MKLTKYPVLIGMLFGVATVGSVSGQLQDGSPVPLPFEDPLNNGPNQSRFGVNSFGPATMHRDVNVQEIPMPPGDEIQVPPGKDGQPIGGRRIYLTVRYYGCRPWFIHPYTGAQLSPIDLVANIGCSNPEWQAAAAGRPLEELLQPDPNLGGDALVEIIDEGLIDEDNRDAREEWDAQALAEADNAGPLGENIKVSPIWHAPYYGLYCLRIRYCIPYTSVVNGSAWRYWIHWRYRLHQPWCWRQWWWHWWRPHPVSGWWIRPWYPLCIPHTYWTRQGPDWVWHVTSANRYRYWCLYGLRYYCTPFGLPPSNINPVPLQAQMGLFLQPGGAVTPWLRPWPYPRWGYWPYRPYCTRWYWFRPTPWLTYRYLPPVIQYAIAAPSAPNGGGFVPGPDPQKKDRAFPPGPPVIAALDNAFDQEAPENTFFNQGFEIVGAATSRALVRSMSDSDGDGVASFQDQPRVLRQERGFDVHDDAMDMIMPAQP